MEADCFHILLNFPFLNEESGTVLDLKYCLGAETLRFQSTNFRRWQVCRKAAADSPATLALCCRAPCANLGGRTCRRERSVTKGSFHLLCGSFNSMTLKAHGMQWNVKWDLLLWAISSKKPTYGNKSQMVFSKAHRSPSPLKWHLTPKLSPKVSIFTCK